MNPAILLAAAAAAAAFFAFRKSAPALTPEQRAAAMTRLPDLLHKIITKVGTPADRAMWAQEAVQLAIALMLPKTVEGIKTSRGMPADEVWPGTSVSVAKYMGAYVEARKPKALPKPGAAPAAKTYNDEVPVPPYEDPRGVRAKALAAERSGKGAEAKVYHMKADALNTMIKAAKMKNAAKAGWGALKSLVK